MQLLLPEILAELTPLSPALLAIGGTAGLILWIAGWWSHRFWIVLSATILGGLNGLLYGPTMGVPAIPAALLLAISLGLVALSLMRVFAFFAGGIACLILMNLLAPTIQAPLIVMLIGGIISILLYRLWMIGTTSFAGAVLLSYFGMACASRFLDMQSNVRQVIENDSLANWIVIGLTILGIIGQLIFSRKKDSGREKEGDKGEQNSKKKGGKSDPRMVEKSWSWPRLPFRKAA